LRTVRFTTGPCQIQKDLAAGGHVIVPLEGADPGIGPVPGSGAGSGGLELHETVMVVLEVPDDGRQPREVQRRGVLGTVGRASKHGHVLVMSCCSVLIRSISAACLAAGRFTRSA